MPASEPDILSALQTLREAPREILQAHRESALQTLVQLRAVLTVNSHDGTRAVADLSVENFGQQGFNAQTSSKGFYPQHSVDSVGPSVSNDNAPRPSTTMTFNGNCEVQVEPENQNTRGSESIESDRFNSLSPAPSFAGRRPDDSRKRKRKRGSHEPSRPARLVQVLQKHIADLVQFAKSKPSLQRMLRIEQDVKFFMDLRVDHIKRVDGNKTPSNQERLLKSLCQISLARQFTAWERDRGWPSRVEELRSQVAKCTHQIDKRKKGRISQYIRNAGYPLSDHKAVNKAICQGTVQVLFKDLLEQALGSSGQQSLVEGIFSAVTVFQPFRFQSLKINELPQVIDLLRLFDDHGTPATEGAPSRFLHSLEAADAWSESIQSEFESICMEQRQKSSYNNSSQMVHRTILSSEDNSSDLQSVDTTEISHALSNTPSSLQVQPLNNTRQQSDCVQPSHNSNTTLRLQSFNAAAERSAPLRTQSDEFFFAEALPHPEMFSVLDPSSHVAGINTSFPNIESLNTAMGDDGARQPFQLLSPLDPSCHVQDINFTLLNPAEHVQNCDFSSLGESSAAALPAADSIPSTVHGTADRSALSSGDYVSNSSVGSSSRILPDSVPTDFVFSEPAGLPHMGPMEYVQRDFPGFET